MRPLRLGFSLWSQATSWPAILKTSRLIDRLGYDYLFTQDHLYATFGEMRQPVYEGWTLLGAMAQATRHVQLGLLVGANTFRNPGLVAKMVATLDHISSGRAIVGLGAGWFEPEHVAHGLPFGATTSERLQWLDASAGIVRSLLRGHETEYASSGYAFHGAMHAPLPIRAEMPLLIGGSGEKWTLRTVARYADMWNAMGSLKTLQHKSNVLDAYCEALGRDPGSIERSVTCKLVIRDDPAEARRVWEQALANNLTSPDIEPDPWLGPPERIAARIAAHLEIGVTTVIASLPAPYDTETIRRLRTEVGPMLAPP